MTTKLSLFGLGLLLVLAAGCATDKTPIVFLSQPQIPQYMTADAAVATAVDQLEGDDEEAFEGHA